MQEIYEKVLENLKGKEKEEIMREISMRKGIELVISILEAKTDPLSVIIQMTVIQLVSSWIDEIQKIHEHNETARVSDIILVTIKELERAKQCWIENLEKLKETNCHHEH